MKSYEIYITKSYMASKRISQSFLMDVEGKTKWHIYHGCTTSCDEQFIPSCYISKENFYAALVFDDVSIEKFELNLC